ncbi:MAG: hypothetical protein U0R70_13400 [Solirubrobacteraceae bacterium]
MVDPATPEELDAQVEGLLAAWCARRAYGPLRDVLPAWPLMPLTDGYAELRDGLAAARRRSPDGLTPEEAATADRCLAALDRALER